jgi:prevent-host-death family protein
MRYSTHVKPISYVKAHAAEIMADLAETREPMLITQNGEPAAVIQDVHSYEADQQTLALLKMLAIGEQQVAEGKVMTLKEAVAQVKARRKR